MKLKFCFTIIIIPLLLISCVSKEQRISEKILKEQLLSPSSYHFISFELEKEETMEDEIKDSLDFYTHSISTDSSWVAFYYDSMQIWEKYKDDFSIQKYKENEEEYRHYLDKLNQDKEKYETLIKTKQTQDCSKVTHRIYVLTYDSQNAFGAILRHKFTTRFDTEGNLVSYTGDHCSRQGGKYSALIINRNAPKS